MKKMTRLIIEIAQKEKKEKIDQGLVLGKKEQTHIGLSLPLSATIKPGGTVCSSHVRTLKSKEWLAAEEQNSKYRGTNVVFTDETGL